MIYNCQNVEQMCTPTPPAPQHIATGRSLPHHTNMSNDPKPQFTSGRRNKKRKAREQTKSNTAQNGEVVESDDESLDTDEVEEMLDNDNMEHSSQSDDEDDADDVMEE